MDFFPYRGQYGGSALGATLFVAVRAFVPPIFYALLAPPTSSYSIFSKYPFLSPRHPPPINNISIPLIPDSALNSLSTTLGLPPYSAIVFLGATLPSLSFAAYNLLWRRERLPLKGQGGSYQITTQVNLTDIVHGFLYVYTASFNPTWSPTLFSYTIIPFIIGLVLHVTADHSKYLFRKDPKNKEKGTFSQSNPFPLRLDLASSRTEISFKAPIFKVKQCLKTHKILLASNLSADLSSR
jgi:hypothetical protein